MRRKRTLLFIVLVIAVFFVNAGIISHRGAPGTQAIRYDPMERIPLLLMGSFRGIAIDFLWARALARHEEKKYYELLAVNNLIAKLQPNFPAVWIFQAWNMAYNIAHEWDAPQNKWKWIRAGLDFSKRGAEKNPGSGDLFFEIGYMYLHLFDQRFFKCAPYYREQLKREAGEDNYEASLYWIRRSLENNPKVHNVLAIERTIYHALWHASLCAETERDVPKALQYVESAILGWKNYRKHHQEDTAVDVNVFIDNLEKKRVFLQNLQKGEEW